MRPPWIRPTAWPRLVPRAPRLGLGAAMMMLAVLPPSGRPVRAEDAVNPPIDQGRFVVSLHGRTIGFEDFTYRVLGDSLCLAAHTAIERNLDGKPDSVSKTLFLAVGVRDHSIHVYKSSAMFRGMSYVVGVLCRDTTYTIFREIGDNGGADRHVMPPGRAYILDSMMYSLMDLISMSLHEQAFTTRPITLLVLSPRDTLVEGTVTRVGTDTLQYHQRPTQAQHWTLSQGGVDFEMWVDRRGRVLRIENVPTGLRVERYAQKVKPRPASKPGG